MSRHLGQPQDPGKVTSYGDPSTHRDDMTGEQDQKNSCKSPRVFQESLNSLFGRLFYFDLPLAWKGGDQGDVLRL